MKTVYSPCALREVCDWYMLAGIRRGVLECFHKVLGLWARTDARQG